MDGEEDRVIPTNETHRSTLERALLIMAESQTRLADAAIRCYDGLSNLVVMVEKYIKHAHERMNVIENNAAQLQRNIDHAVKLISAAHEPVKLDVSGLYAIQKQMESLLRSMDKRLPPAPPPEPPMLDKLIDDHNLSFRAYNLIKKQFGGEATQTEILSMPIIPGLGMVAFREILIALARAGVPLEAIQNSVLYNRAPAWVSEELIEKLKNGAGGLAEP